MKAKFRFRRLYKGGRISIIGGIITTIGGLVINDLKKENSIIKNTLKKIPYFL